MVAQTPWTERTFSFDFPVSNFPVIFSRLEGTVFRLQRILLNADDETCGHNEHGWSVKEHVGHLYDLEELWWKRLVDFTESRATLTAADMRNAKTNEAAHNNKSLETLLLMFATKRQQLLETVFPFDKEMLQKTALHPRLNKPMRLIDSLFFVAEHDDNHIATISNLLTKH